MTARVRRRFALPPTMAASVAAVLIVALVLFTMDLTPSARADTLLNKAAWQQSEEQQEHTSILLRSEGHACAVSTNFQLVSLGDSGNSSCKSMTAQLHRVGWTGNDGLSASSFRAWRKSLPHKTDSIRKVTDATEIQTETNDSPIRKAVLRLRDSDDHPVTARYEFAAEGNEPAAIIEVGEQSGLPPVLTAHSSDVPVPKPAELPSHSPAVAVINPLDDAEAHAWLALSHAGLTSDVLVAVNRQPDAVKVWGVVPTEQAKADLTSALQSQPEMQVDITTDGAQESPSSSLPWTAWRGNIPPLAADQLQAQFPNDPQASQQFLNDMDMLTRRLVAETRSREAMLTLADRMPASALAASLRDDTAKLDTSIRTDLSSLATRLGPLLGSGLTPAHRLSYEEATRLYALVHELFFMGRSQDSLDRDSAWAQTRRLLSQRAS